MDQRAWPTPRVKIRSTLKKTVGPPVNLRRLKEDDRPQTSPSRGMRALTFGPETLGPLEDISRPKTSSGATTLSSCRSCPSIPLPRCFGCGNSVPEMCLQCFSACKKNDMTKYKQSLAKGVEWLFTKATTRAFNHVASTLTRMIFGVWKFYVRHRRHHREYILRFQTRVRLRKILIGWRLLVHERRTYGAMLYAAEEHARVENLEIETDQLHGTVTELTKRDDVRAQLDSEKFHRLHASIEVEKRRVVEKNKELATLKMQLAVATKTIEELQEKAKAVDTLAPLEEELFDYKKACFQMANEMLNSMERQWDDYTVFEGQQNLSDMLSNDVVNSLDHAEHPLLYDPTAKFAKDMKKEEKLAAARKKKEASSSGTVHIAAIDRADRILMQWANAMMRKTPVDWIKAARINNCNTNLQDGKAYAVLTYTLHEAMCKMKMRKKAEGNPLQRENGLALSDEANERYVALLSHESGDQRRIEFVMNTIGQAMWLPTEFVTPDDILAGDTDFNLVLLGYLFCTSSPVLDDNHFQHVNDITMQLTIERAKWRELKELSETLMDGSVSKKIKLALAHLFELKKKLDTDMKRAHDGHLLWWKCSRIVLRKCFLTLSMMAHGKSGFMCSADKSADNEGFLVVPRDKLKSIVFSNEDMKWEFDMLQGYLNSVFNDLARIYRGYASRSTNNAEDVAVMSQGDLISLVQECNIPDTNFAMTDMAEILIEVTQSKLAAENGVVDVHRALLPAEFIEALIRIARKRYSGLYKKTALSESFCLLVDNQILPYAYQSDADKFRKQVESPGIRSLLIKYLDDMKTLFGKYSLDLASNKKNRKQVRMTAHSLLKFVSDKNIEDMSFTNDRIMQVIGYVCQGRTLSRTELMQREVSFESFQEAMIAMACHKFPDPYLSLENRFEKFANLYIISIRSM